MNKGSIQLSMNAIVVIVLSIVIMSFGFFILGKVFQLENTIDLAKEKSSFDFDGILGIKQTRFQVDVTEPVIINFGLNNQLSDGTNEFLVYLNQIILLDNPDSTTDNGKIGQNGFIPYQVVFASSGIPGQKHIMQVSGVEFRDKNYFTFAISDIGDFKDIADQNGKDNKFFILEFMACPGTNTCDVSGSVEQRKYYAYVEVQ